MRASFIISARVGCSAPLPLQQGSFIGSQYRMRGSLRCADTKSAM
jgi:hypothetical protein